MKKLLLVALAVTTLTACRKDDDKETSKIVGTWKPVKYLTVDGVNGAILESEDADSCEGKGSFQFKNNGDFIQKSFGNDNGSCTSDPVENGTYIYSESPNTLTLNYTNENNEEYQEATVEVVKLTNTELQFVGDSGDDTNGDNIADPRLIVLAKQ